MKIINEAIQRNQYTLSEYESKQILDTYGIPVTKVVLVDDIENLLMAIEKIGYPLVIKGCARGLSHKTETGLVRLDIRNETEALSAYKDLMGRMQGEEKQVIVQQMVKGQRELMVGMIRDPQFGPCVMFGLGGVFTEVLNDSVFRVAPLEKKDAFEMVAEIKGRRILEDFRGMKSVDKKELAQILVSVGQIGLENDRIKEIDINPIIITAGKPIAVDALVILERN
jgi:succinyl-CoA synthetase beta subunit